MKSIQVDSINHLLLEVKMILDGFKIDVAPWFRGEPKVTPTPLIPKVFRINYPENELLQNFRMKAPTLSPGQTPPKNSIDEWLFLAQHMGLPTRLLDWTESLLIATYFSLQEHDKGLGSIVWMLIPSELNHKSTGSKDFDLTWFSPETDLVAWIKTLLIPDKRLENPNINYLDYLLAILRSSRRPRENFANKNIRGAWEDDKIGTKYPVAIYPTSIHPRMSTQKSCFTIHRRTHPPLYDFLLDYELIRFEIPDSESIVESFKTDIRLLGITNSTIYPDLMGLAKELDETHKPKLKATEEEKLQSLWSKYYKEKYH